MNELHEAQPLPESPPAATSAPQGEKSTAGPALGPNDAPVASSAPYISAETKIGEVKGDTYSAAEQTFYQNQYEYKYDRPERPRLSPSHFETLDGGRLKREGENLFWGTSEQEVLASALERRRLLLLCGEPELGKGGVARLLASAMCARHDLKGLFYCRQSPSRDMEVPFQEIFGSSSDYHKRVIVLKDALVQDNLDVRRFLGRLDELQLECRSEELRSSGSFLIITSDSERLGGIEAKLHGLGILRTLSGPPPETLLEVLHRLATTSLHFSESSTREQLHELLRSEGARIAKELGTLPRVARFVRESLLSLLSGRISLDQALRRAYDLESWLLRDLPEDFDAWSYALALVLCHAAPIGENVTWMHFDRFRQLLARYLRQEIRRFGDKRAAIELCREDDLLRLARAEVQVPGYPQAATVAFLDDTYPPRLWKILLGPGRQLLALIIPLMQSLMSAPEFYLRSIAARALGRIGELDPSGVTFISLQHPGEGSEERRARLIGQVVQGVLGSDDHQYRHACLRQLRRKLRSYQEVRVALTSLKDVGELDLSMALQEMRAAADHWLIPRSEEGKKPDPRQSLKGRLRTLEDLARVDSRVANLLRVAEDGNLRGIMEEIFSKEGVEVMGALQYSLVGLCLGRHPVSLVLSELQSWAGEEGSESGLFLMLLFLSPHGIFDVLNRISMTAPSSKSEANANEECGVVLYDLAYLRESAIPELQAFLEALYAQLATLPGSLRKGLRKRWLGILKGWAKQACTAEACRPAVRSLLGGLVRSRAPEVRRDILSMLQADSDFSISGSNMQFLAIEAITST